MQGARFQGWVGKAGGGNVPNLLGAIFLVELPFYDRVPTSPYLFQLVGLGLPAALYEDGGGVQTPSQ